LRRIRSKRPLLRLHNPLPAFPIGY
jgi:hypothetical protein